MRVHLQVHWNAPGDNKGLVYMSSPPILDITCSRGGHTQLGNLETSLVAEVKRKNWPQDLYPVVGLLSLEWNSDRK